MYLLELPWRGDSHKYTKRIIHKKNFKSIHYSCFIWVHVKFLYNSKFDLTAKSLVTNSVVITRVLCNTAMSTLPKAMKFDAVNCQEFCQLTDYNWFKTLLQPDFQKICHITFLLYSVNLRLTKSDCGS